MGGATVGGATVGGATAGRGDAVAYSLEDMADDTVGLLDALAIPRAHLVGTSMGGMIAQTLAIGYPERVRSLCSIMSTTGAPDVGQPTPEAMAVVARRPPADRAAYVEAELANFRIIGSRAHWSTSPGAGRASDASTTGGSTRRVWAARSWPSWSLETAARRSGPSGCRRS